MEPKLRILPSPATTHPRWIDAALAAKLLRKDLASAFPEVKFSVRVSRYSGGSSLSVRWQAGPSSKLVDVIAQRYAGARFDGMTDSETSIYDERDGERVQYGSKYVHCYRDLPNAVELWREVEQAILERCACELVGTTWRFGNDWVQTIAQRIVEATDFLVETPLKVLDAWLSGKRQIWR